LKFHPLEFHYAVDDEPTLPRPGRRLILGMPFRRLPTAMRGIASIVTGSIAGQGLVILSYPLLTRLYDPAELGLLTVFTSVVGMIGVISTACLEPAVPIPEDDGEAADVAWAALAAVVGTTVLTAVAGFLLADPVARLLGVPALARYSWLVALTVFILGAYMVLSEWMVRDRTYGALGRRNLFQGIGQVVTQVGLGLAGVRPLGLLLGVGVGRALAMGGLLSRGGLLRQRRPTLAGLRAAVRRFRRFPLLAAPSALVNAAGLEMPLLLVSALYGDARAGLLGLTIRVFSGPTAIIGQAVSQVYTGETGAAIRKPTGELGRLLRGAVRRLFLLGVGPAFVLVVAGPWMFGLIFGPTWTEAGEYARYLAVAYLAQFAVTPVSSTLFLLERQGRELVWGCLRLLLTAGGVAACGLLGEPVQIAVIVLAVGHVVSYAVLFGLCVRAADDADMRRQPSP
jgi:O-antigen/teichoic acid export membrane protein